MTHSPSNQQPTALIPVDILESVTFKSKDLVLPSDYSAENALQAAWLIILETIDTVAKKPVLESCTKPSIVNSLLRMLTQGLNPVKKQCYFIPYGGKLSCKRSYFGTMAVARRVAGATDIYPELIYKGDEFEYEIFRGRKVVTKHTQKLENVNVQNIIAAYCIIEFFGSQESYTEIMTINQIQRAWAKSPVRQDAEGSTHKQFPDEMAKRTVVDRACKRLINSSSDRHLFVEQPAYIEIEEEALDEIASNANQELLGLDTDIEEPREDREAPHYGLASPLHDGEFEPAPPEELANKEPEAPAPPPQASPGF